jgi:hypothetical protein
MSDRTETIRWSLSNGAEATVTVSLKRATRHLGTNGHTGEAITRDEGLEIEVEGRAEGHGTLGNSYTERDISEAHRASGVVGTVGRLAVKTAQAEQIKAAIARLEADPEYAKQQARRREADARSQADRDSRRRIERTS